MFKFIYLCLFAFRLSSCNLSGRVCEDLLSALSSQSSLREMDLSTNSLKDSGVIKLSAAVDSQHSKLEILRSDQVISCYQLIQLTVKLINNGKLHLLVVVFYYFSLFIKFKDNLLNKRH